ncbi:unnamed protein product [Symbiodinium microadriaticum]|nr:unnamed protein product [Symbiodinium microadriaticum]
MAKPQPVKVAGRLRRRNVQAQTRQQLRGEVELGEMLTDTDSNGHDGPVILSEIRDMIWQELRSDVMQKLSQSPAFCVSIDEKDAKLVVLLTYLDVSAEQRETIPIAYHMLPGLEASDVADVVKQAEKVRDEMHMASLAAVGRVHEEIGGDGWGWGSPEWNHEKHGKRKREECRSGTAEVGGASSRDDIHCAAHRLNLAVSAAYKGETLHNLESVISTLFRRVKQHPTCQIDLQFWSEVTSEPLLTSLAIAKTRWLSQLSEAISNEEVVPVIQRCVSSPPLCFLAPRREGKQENGEMDVSAAVLMADKDSGETAAGKSKIEECCAEYRALRVSKLRLRYEVTGGISKEYWCEMKDLGSPAEIKELLRTIRSFAEQTLENLVVRFGDVPLVLAHQILSPRWSFKQPDLVESAKALAAFWKVDEQALVSQLRAAFAIRDSLISEDSALKTARSKEVWLRVLSRMTSSDSDAVAREIIASFLVIQPQSAACERAFATVEEYKLLGQRRDVHDIPKNTVSDPDSVLSHFPVTVRYPF